MPSPSRAPTNPFALVSLVALLMAVPAHSAAPAGASPPAAPITLRFSLPPGDYTLTVETRYAAVTLNGLDVSPDPSPTGGMRQPETCAAVIHLAARPPAADGTQTVRVTYKRLRRSMKRFEQDTDAPAARYDPNLPPYRDLVGIPFDVTCNADGVPQRISGMAEWFDRQKSDASPLRASNLQIIRSQFGEKMLQGWLSWVHGALPRGPIRPGESWQSTLPIPIASLPKLESLRLKQTWTLKSIDRSSREPHAEITVAGDVSSTFDKRTLTAALGVDEDDTLQSAKVTAKTEGTLARDVATAQLRRVAYTTETSTTLTSRGGNPVTIREPVAVTMTFAAGPPK